MIFNRIFVLCLSVLICSTSFSFAASKEQIHNPMLFERNMGQEDPSILYLARGVGFNTLLSNTGVQFQFSSKKGADSAFTVELEGSNSNMSLKHIGSLRSRIHYYNGNEPSKWITEVPAFGSAIYKDAYPGIDWVFYENEGLVEYDFVVAPGVDPEVIRMNLNGADQLSIDQSGNLIVSIQANEFRMLAPVVYQCDQYESGQCLNKKEIDSKYKIASNRTIEFELGNYERNKTLIIDPKIAFGTLLGGNTFDNALDVAVDTKGNFYVVGYTEANTRIPGNGDGFVHKFSPSGALIWTTFLVGSSGEDARSIKVNPAGICFVGGSTSSRDFPIAGAFQAKFGGSIDGFIVKLAANGTIMRSSFLGGTGRDSVNGVELGKGGILGNGLYVFGTTDSRNFPRKNAGQAQYGGGLHDGFITLIHAITFQQLMSSYVGTSGNDELTSLSLNAARGDLYAVSLSDNSQGHFIAQLKPKRSNVSITKPSAPPEINYEHGIRFIAGFLSMPVEIVARFKSIKVLSEFLQLGLGSPNPIAKSEESTELLTLLSIDLCSPASSCNENSALFFLTQDLIVRQTVNYGGPKTGAIFTNDIAAGRDGTIYVVGDTLSNSLPKVNAFQPSRKGGWEGFVNRFAKDTQQLTLSSYLGGPAFDFANAVAVDNAGNMYVVGQTSSKNFPTTPGAPKRSVTGTADGYVVRISP